MVTVADSGHGNKDSSKVHLGAVIGMLSEIKDHSFDGASLCSVNSHGKGQVKWKGVADLCSGNRSEKVVGGIRESVPIRRSSRGHVGGDWNDNVMWAAFRKGAG